MNYNLDKFKHGLKELHIELTDEQTGQFVTFYEMLTEKNKVMNLTAVTEFEDVVEKHFIDSLSLVRAVHFESSHSKDNSILNENMERELSNQIHSDQVEWQRCQFDMNNFRMIDMGTGAGFPGLPLKIAFPELNITLADSLNKRILFLDEVIAELGLKNIETVHGRAEELARNTDYREKYDLCVSRAVANLSSLSEYCIPFVKEKGCFISYKSGEVEDEAAHAKNAIFLLGGKLQKIEKFELPGTDLKRSFVVIEKVKKTPKAYPRKAGTPTKNPL